MIVLAGGMSDHMHGLSNLVPFKFWPHSASNKICVSFQRATKMPIIAPSASPLALSNSAHQSNEKSRAMCLNQG